MTVKSKKATPARPAHNNLYGIFFILLHVIALSVLYVTMKHLTKDITSHLAAFLYKFTILIFILPWCFKNGLKGVKTTKFWLHLPRGFLSIGGTLCLFYAIKHVGSVADVTAVGYLEQILLVIVGILYFKESVTLPKIATIMLSFLGAVIVMQPQLAEFKNGSMMPDFFVNNNISSINPYYGFVLLSVVFWGSNAIIVKLLGKTEKTKVQLFYVNLFSCIIAFPFAFMNWIVVNNIGVVEISIPHSFMTFEELGLKTEHIKFIIILALCYFTHSIAFFLSLKYAELSTVIPFDYSRLIFTALLGYAFLEQAPSHGSYIGYIMIAGAGIYLVRAEAKRRKKISDQKIRELEEEYEHA